ncbi:hypothetical protein [Pseudonocardia sp. ICBG601]|uniref:hypothetical protein n=1 Tax=Pseudonocardia sp. ICBG601 TaxID=2846759 RepID=UPI001CF6D369|nr:hypothetical protein [Pseudonocardia sp. ICBG601]
MNTHLHRAVTAGRDRLVEIAVVTALTGATLGLTWWFAAPLGFVTGWWAAAELRLRQVHRAVPASTTRGELPAADAVSGTAESPAEPVSAGQQVEGRARA